MNSFCPDEDETSRRNTNRVKRSNMEKVPTLSSDLKDHCREQGVKVFLRKSPTRTQNRDVVGTTLRDNNKTGKNTYRVNPESFTFVGQESSGGFSFVATSEVEGSRSVTVRRLYGKVHLRG